MDARKTRKRLALAITAALLLPGMAFAQTAKEKELEARIAQLEAQVQALVGAHEIAFDPTRDLILHRRRSLPEHPNGMRFRCLGTSGDTVAERVLFSVGGGFVVDAAHVDAEPATQAAPEPYPYASAAELLDWCRETGLSMAEVVLANARS